jgi:hypothetical protein
MHFKCFQELLQNFVLSFLSAFNIWVSAGIVLSFYIIDVKNTIAIVINLLESLLDNLSSKLIHGSHNHSDEFIKVNVSTSIEIESLEKIVDILIINVYLEVLDSLSELIEIKTTTAIIIHDLELSSKSNHASTTSGLKLVSESLNKHALELRNWLSVLDDNLTLTLNWALSRLWIITSRVWVSGWHFLFCLSLELFVQLNLFLLIHWWG